jgi:hypothetical protein
VSSIRWCRRDDAQRCLSVLVVPHGNRKRDRSSALNEEIKTFRSSYTARSGIRIASSLSVSDFVKDIAFFKRRADFISLISDSKQGGELLARFALSSHKICQLFLSTVTTKASLPSRSVW